VAHRSDNDQARSAGLPPPLLLLLPGRKEWTKSVWEVGNVGFVGFKVGNGFKMVMVMDK
jgi:hypothetical protein